MKQNSQLSDVLHVLLHMAEGDGPSTSETLGNVYQALGAPVKQNIDFAVIGGSCSGLAGRWQMGRWQALGSSDHWQPSRKPLSLMLILGASCSYKKSVMDSRDGGSYSFER